MDEIEKIHQADDYAGWGTVSTLLAKSADMAQDMGRDDIFNMLSEAFDEMEKIKDPAERFFNCFQYAFRIYYRLKVIGKDVPLNRTSKEKYYEKNIAKTGFRITNYSYSIFNWARNKGIIEQIDNVSLVVPADKLTPAEVARFDSQAEKV